MDQFKTGFFIMTFFVIVATRVVIAESDDNRKAKPPASLSPSSEFGASTPAPPPRTSSPHPTTPAHNTTTPTGETTTVPAKTTTVPAKTTAPATTPAYSTTTLTGKTTTDPAKTTTVPAKTTATTPAAPNMTTTAVTNTTATTPPMTTPGPPPPPMPTPAANVTVGRYNVSTGGKLCIMANMALQLRVNNSKAIGTFIVQPNKTAAKGNCQSSKAGLILQFGEGSIKMEFTRNDTTQTVFLNALTINVTYAFTSKGNTLVYANNMSVELFKMTVGHSYSCQSEFVDVGDGVHLEVTKIKLQAFNFTNNQFGMPDLCRADQPDYTVPIAVGIVLIVLIVIVIIVYLISRRRMTAGYQTL